MEILQDADLSEILWYKIGGKAKYLLVCQSREDILRALDFLAKNSIEKVFICGLGSNLIFTDDYFDGAVISIIRPHPNPLLSGEGIRFVKEDMIEAFAGVLLDDVIHFAFSSNLVGLEWAGGLPGTVGAAVRGNVGAFGGEVKDIVVSAKVLDYVHIETRPGVSLQTVSNKDLQFVYRGSLVKNHKKMIVVSAKFQLQKGSKEELARARKVYEKNVNHRKEHHPLEYPNCGSVFKNLRDKEQIKKVLEVYPELQESVEKKWYGKVAVASLIEKMGLKGYRVGDAQISEKHALFIVNLGHAKAKDVLSIIATIQKKFQEKFGFSLETEVEIVN